MLFSTATTVVLKTETLQPKTGLWEVHSTTFLRMNLAQVSVRVWCQEPKGRLGARHVLRAHPMKVSKLFTCQFR